MSSNRLTVSSAGIVASLDFFTIDMKADIELFRLPTTSNEQLKSVSTAFHKMDTCVAKSFALYLLFTLMEAVRMSSPLARIDKVAGSLPKAKLDMSL
ncbi:hypothetical protein [Brevibacillus laterosporus]|uniref:hypothetical protein n=1 Tax=Brevibacillus laterosporus TaxID=1465 RepID=UPI001C3EB41F|nr:hypothetical protein [Brevibacillus laterosporus]